MTEFEKVEFTAGAGEAKALADAFAATKNFKAEVQSGKDQAIVMNVSQNAFTPGTDPQVTNEDYSNGFVAVEPYEFNTICVDTEETAVHILMQSFMKRIFGVGSLTQGVVAEKHTVDLETRMSPAASFNDEKMNYVLNAYVNEQGKEIDGYQTAARLAGMIGACASNSSLTHTVVSGFSEILERLTNTQMIAAEKKGCIVLSYSSAKQVWIDYAINTLITPADNQDDGWKKIIEDFQKVHENEERMELQLELEEAHKEQEEADKKVSQMSQEIKQMIQDMLSNGMSVSQIAKCVSKSEEEILELIC